MSICFISLNFFFRCPCHLRHLHSFPTRRSSDLARHVLRASRAPRLGIARRDPVPRARRGPGAQDRKSTRLNSSHVAISYAVFCLKKKNATTPEQKPPDRARTGSTPTAPRTPKLR